MNKIGRKVILIGFLLITLAAGCDLIPAVMMPIALANNQSEVSPDEDLPPQIGEEETVKQSIIPKPENIEPEGVGHSEELSTALLEVELENDPPVLNPLTGTEVLDPETLDLPPALVSVTNFPISARPQLGLSFSPIVFELFIGDGETRYLALFYGDYPDTAVDPENKEFSDDLMEGVPQLVPSVGPIRSGRLPYEYIRQLYNGFIVMASAYSKVADQLGNHVNVFGDDESDPNSAMMPIENLKAVAEENKKDLANFNLTGMHFDSEPPEGEIAHSLWIFYSYLNQVFWRYNQEDGSYHRWQDQADGSTFVEQTDRLNGEPLTYENVIVLFAEHEVEKQYLIDINLLFVPRGKALLFRDETVQEIYWTTRNEEYEQKTGLLRPIRFLDAEGNPIALKPGQTWIELMPEHLAFWETIDSEKYNQLASGRKPGSGFWGLYFKPPK